MRRTEISVHLTTEISVKLTSKADEMNLCYIFTRLFFDQDQNSINMPIYLIILKKPSGNFLKNNNFFFS